MPSLFWALFFLLIIGLLVIDLLIEKRNGRKKVTLGQSITWTLLWISVALSFNVGVYFIYENGLVPIESLPGYPAHGKEAALYFFTGYVIEKSLSLDNIFVIALIFSYFHIPAHLQHRVLLWGVFGAIFLRFLMITLGASLIAHFTFMNYIFGGLLLITALKMLLIRQENINPNHNIAVRLFKKMFSVTDHLEGEAFFVRKNGVLWMTPLFLALVVVETSDVIFAIDSIPAIFAITSDPFLVFTSNIFAILGLRSLYFVLVSAINRFYYLRFSLVFLLAFVGIKLVLAHHYHINTLWSLGMILGILLTGVLASIFEEKMAAAAFMPIYEQFRQIAIVTLKDLKKIVILLFGITLLLAGLAMLVLPGPGIVFIMMGLAVLAKEVLWARRLLKKLKQQQNELGKFFKGEEETKK